MLGWMQGGYNVQPLVEALDLDQACSHDVCRPIVGEFMNEQMLQVLRYRLLLCCSGYCCCLFVQFNVLILFV